MYHPQQALGTFTCLQNSQRCMKAQTVQAMKVSKRHECWCLTTEKSLKVVTQEDDRCYIAAHYNNKPCSNVSKQQKP